MNAKKLDQSVFEGLPSEYRFAMVYPNGVAFAYTESLLHGSVVEIGCGFDASTWEQSKIERQAVPTAVDIDWSRQEVPAGATHYQRACATTKNTARYFKDDFSKAFVLTHPENGWIDFPKEVLTPEAYANMLVVPSKPEPQVDWSKAPEGATHYNTSSGAFFKRLDNGLVQVFAKTAGEWASLGAYTVFDLESSTHTIKRPESITDVARSIEAARVAEKSMPYPDGDARYFETSDVPETKKYPHYFKDVSAVDAIDLYHVARLYEITDPALFHAFKKIACAGRRGAKDQAQDVQEAIDALKRWQELNV